MTVQVRDGGGRRLRAEGGAGDWSVRHQGGTVLGALRVHPAGPDPDQGTHPADAASLVS